MILNRLILKDFRQFEGGNNIMNFNPIGDKHITLVFASNGVGKTTILSAIDWCLYGGKEIPYGDYKNVFLNKNTFEKMVENEEKVVEVILSFNDRDSEYVIKRSIVVKKVHGKQVNTKFNAPQVEINETLHFDGQRQIESVLSQAMRGYFFFKGEGVGKYADSSNPKLVQKGIKNIMKIEFREQAKELIEKVRRKLDKESALLQESQGSIDIPETRKQELEDAIEKEKLNIQTSEDKIGGFDTMLMEVQEALSKVKSTQDLNKQAKIYQADIDKLNEDQKKLIIEQKALIVKKAYLGLSNEILQDTHRALESKRKNGELPIIRIGRDFIQSLINKHKCICGEEFKDGDSHHEELLKILNSTTAKSGLEASVSSLGAFIIANLDAQSIFKDQFDKITSTMNDNSNSLKQLEKQLNAIEEKILEELPEEDNLIKQRNELRTNRDDALSSKAKSEEKIEVFNKELKVVNEQIANTTVHDESISKNRARVSFCEQAITMLETENEIEIEKIRAELSMRLQNQFETILHSNKTAELDEDFKLRVLENGQPTAKSDGENKLISLIFISTLIDMAREKETQKNDHSIDPGAGIYPIVIDSPYGEFDSVYKKNISEAVKKLAPQVIILMNQEHWNEGKTIGNIFKDSLAHQYALVAHRPKLNVLESERNVLRFENCPDINLEIQDDREYTTIEKIGVPPC